jgi:hypothetical protein
VATRSLFELEEIFLIVCQEVLTRRSFALLIESEFSLFIISSDLIGEGLLEEKSQEGFISF